MSYDPGTSGISGANDVALSNPASNDALLFNGTLGLWQNQAVTKSQVGLANVDNTSDTNKPISTATQAALDTKANDVHTHQTSDISDSTAIGRSLMTAANAATVRSAIGAGTSNFDGQYSSLSATPTLGSAASRNVGTTTGTVAAGDDPRFSASGSQRSANFIVVASDATGIWNPDYTCDGTQDDIQINAAIAACATSGGRVLLSDGTFNIKAPIALRTGTALQGQGKATIIKNQSGFVGNGMIIVNDVNVHLTTLRDLYLDGNNKTLNASSGTINGVWYNNSGGAFTGVPSSSPDPVHMIDNLYIRDVSGCGINMSAVAEPDDATTTSGNTRGSWFSNVFVFGPGRWAWFCISPDSYFVGCTGAATPNDYDAWLVRSSNCRFVACKGYYGGRDCWRVIGTRHEFSACEAQDAGRHGWSLEGYWNIFSACASDSSGRLKASYSGVGDGVYLSWAKYSKGDFAIYDRDQTPTSNTRYGINFGGNCNKSSFTFLVDETNFEASAYTGTYTDMAKMELVAKTAATILWNEAAWAT